MHLCMFIFHMHRVIAMARSNLCGQNTRLGLGYNESLYVN